MKGLGTHKDTVRAILEESNLSDADLVKVMDNYNKNHSSLIQDIHGDFSSETRKNYENLLANTLIRQVRNGDETALKLLCKEIHNSTSGMTGTANVFIKKIFDTAESADDGSEIMKKIKDNYSKYNSGEDIYTAIRGDFSFSTEDKYVQILDNAG